MDRLKNQNENQYMLTDDEGDVLSPADFGQDVEAGGGSGEIDDYMFIQNRAETSGADGNLQLIDVGNSGPSVGLRSRELAITAIIKHLAYRNKTVGAMKADLEAHYHRPGQAERVRSGMKNRLDARNVDFTIAGNVLTGGVGGGYEWSYEEWSKERKEILEELDKEFGGTGKEAQKKRDKWRRQHKPANVSRATQPVPIGTHIDSIGLPATKK